ncbi:MAG: GGDEF domain-containing protein [Planctomycetes bacterium]|nr:GGDEF domain-containing protein [Planctomycetota bacterium]
MQCAPKFSAHDATPATVCATGFPLPALYERVLKLGWSELPPWRFVDGSTFLDLYSALNAPPNQSEGPQLLVPFAQRTDDDVVACFRAVPRSEQILLLNPAHGLDAFTAVPDFAAWLHLALEDMIGQPDARSARGTTEPAPEPLPFEPDPEPQDSRSSTRRHLLRVLHESEVDLHFVSAEAGDQPITSPSVRRHHERIKRERGDQLYADMLFVLTQHRYHERMARWLWTRILQHKADMSERLGRPVEVTVASLDFLNQHEHLVEGSLVLCSEDELTQVAEVALRDGLTGLFDQATFKERLGREFERARRYGSPLSLLMLDLDRFKVLNDTHGHPAGDQVLARVGEILRAEARVVDLAARYGGEEFALLLPETAREDALRLAERLRRLVEREFAPGLGATVSVGLASFPGDGQQADDLIEAADQALYRSKQSGRNRITCASRWPKPVSGPQAG